MHFLQLNIPYYKLRRAYDGEEYYLTFPQSLELNNNHNIFFYGNKSQKLLFILLSLTTRIQPNTTDRTTHDMSGISNDELGLDMGSIEDV